MIERLLPTDVFGALLIFARIGSVMMLLPGFGEFYVMARYRLFLAGAMALLLTPILGPSLPPIPTDVGRLVAIVGGEVVIGLFMGTVARVLLSALDTAGMVASLQLGLSAAQIFNPMLAQESTVTASLYSMLGVLLIFLTDLHHMLLRAAVESYTAFPAGTLPAVGDLSDAMARAVAAAFQLGLEMAAPFILLGTLFFVALGMVGRLTPQLPLLFVIQPLQIMGGLVIFAFVLAAGLQWFLENFAQQFAHLIGA